MKQAAISNSFSLATIEDGKDGALVQVSRNTILYDANSTGAATSAQLFAITYSLIVGNVTISASNVTATVLPPTNATATRVTSSGCTINVANGKSPNGVITITLTGTYNNNSYTAKGTITIAPNKAGAGGERGKVGRFYYYGGVFNAGDGSNLFPVNDAQAPFFSHISSGQILYHVFNPDEDVNSNFTMEQMWYESNQSWNNRPWVAMTNDFKYLITEAIFGNFAHFGSAIISGDWMISQHGTINGVASTNFQAFDSNHPNDNTGTNFIPNYCVDLLTGATYQHEAYLTGSLYAQGIQTMFEDVYADGDGLFYVGLQGTSGIWNYRICDEVRIILPTNQYANYGQRVTIYNPNLAIGGSVYETNVVASQVISDGEGGWIYAGNAGQGISLSYDEIRGVGIPKNSTNSGYIPVPINSYDPIHQIIFANGIIELMCVPTSVTGQTCEWCVLNLGTNVIELRKTII